MCTLDATEIIVLTVALLWASTPQHTRHANRGTADKCRCSGPLPSVMMELLIYSRTDKCTVMSCRSRSLEGALSGSGP